MRFGARVYRSILVGTTVVLIAGCGGNGRDPSQSPPDPAGATAQNDASTSPAGFKPLKCTGAGDGLPATGDIGPAGGLVWKKNASNSGGHGLMVPPGSVASTHTFTVTDVKDASGAVIARFDAKDQASYDFDGPVVLMVSYARCTDDDVDALVRSTGKPPEIFLMKDPAGGSDESNVAGKLHTIRDVKSKTLIATTDHLSGYILGAN